MENIIFLIFRRMRAPLLILIVTFAIAVLGMVLIPGVDPQGNPWQMDFFHAFYFVSYMSTTIGFGEVPHEFSDGQRIWVTLTLFATVVAWIYAIGTLITLIQDKTFRQAVTEVRFARRIRRLREGFYLVCGYGQTGGLLVEALTDHNQHAVVIDIDESRVNLLKLQNLRQYVPALCADAGKPLHLLEAGLKHPLCQGVCALTNFNEVNLQIAITSKLLQATLPVICRADSQDVEDNMASFGTDYIIDPYETFATHLATALQKPGLHLLIEWLTGTRNQELPMPVYPPSGGLWILCGYGRFGKVVYERLLGQGIRTVIIEADPQRTRAPDDVIVGRGTEAVTLHQAHIEQAVGLVAGTENDVNNLSIIMTARELNPKLFVVLRQNLKSNDDIVEAVEADMVMHPSAIIANKIRVLLATPLLGDFVRLARNKGDDWACELVSRIIALVSREVPEIWQVRVTTEDTHAICNAVKSGNPVTLGDIVKDPRERSRDLLCIPLLLWRRGEISLLPPADLRLEENDRILFCGRYSAHGSMEWTLQNEHALTYVRTGGSAPQGLVWKMLRGGARSAAEKLPEG